MDTGWINDLKPDEAQAALDALAAHKGAITVREAVELQKLKKRATGESVRTVVFFLPLASAIV
jgi:hypothetical protein